jgi:phage gp46-like protein
MTVFQGTTKFALGSGLAIDSIAGPVITSRGADRRPKVPTVRHFPGHTDIHIVNQASLAGTWDDWLLNDYGGLDESDVLANVVKVALMTDRRADIREILPDPDSSDRRGWWGDLEAEQIWDGWPIGCRNWLLTRAKITGPESSEGATVVRAEEYTRTALQPLLDKNICSAIDVVAMRVGLDRIDVAVTIFRGPREEIELQFQDLWIEVREA